MVRVKTGCLMTRVRQHLRYSLFANFDPLQTRTVLYTAVGQTGTVVLYLTWLGTRLLIHVNSNPRITPRRYRGARG